MAPAEGGVGGGGLYIWRRKVGISAVFLLDMEGLIHGDLRSLCYFCNPGQLEVLRRVYVFVYLISSGSLSFMLFI